MLIEAALLPRNLVNKGNQIHKLIVSVRTFVIPFHYGSGKAKSYGAGSEVTATMKDLLIKIFLFCYANLQHIFVK
jgi:hypothetical protein